MWGTGGEGEGPGEHSEIGWLGVVAGCRLAVTRPLSYDVASPYAESSGAGAENALVMVLYADTVEIGDRVASVAAVSALERTDTLRRFGEALRRGGVGIAAFVNFREEEALRLRGACNGSLIDPACVVVTPCRFEAVRQFRSLGLKPLTRISHTCWM